MLKYSDRPIVFIGHCLGCLIIKKVGIQTPYPRFVMYVLT